MWNSSLYLSGIAVSGLMLRLRAKELADNPEFKASLGWYQNWKRRHSVSMQTKTTLAQHLPNDMEEKIVEFHHFVIAASQRCDYPLSRIFNMDETPMRFELPLTRLLEFSGNRTVPVKSCGAEKRSFTVTLGIAADGTKLPPAVTFKGVQTPRNVVVPSSVWGGGGRRVIKASLKLNSVWILNSVCILYPVCSLHFILNDIASPLISQLSGSHDFASTVRAKWKYESFDFTVEWFASTNDAHLNRLQQAYYLFSHSSETSKL